MMLLDDIIKAMNSPVNPTVIRLDTARLSSVLIIIYGNPPKVLMTKKSSHLNIHAGEIAFPGGKVEDCDADILSTALRETKEELSIDLPRSSIVGQLEPVKTLNSNFIIIPFVCVIDSLPKIRSNSEVDQVLHIPVHPFLKTLRDDPDPSHNIMQSMYTFTFDKHVVWGASARILKQIFDKLSERNLF